jgi:transposase InsO family protein
VSRQGKGRSFSRTLYALEFEGESSSEEEPEKEEPRSYYHDGEFIEEGDLPVDYEYLNFMSYEIEDGKTTADSEIDEILSCYEGKGKEVMRDWEDWEDGEDETAEDYLNLLSVYEMEDGRERTQRDIGHITVRSVPLPQYNAQINSYDGKAIIDSGASTQYIGEKVIDAIEGIRIIDIPPQMIRVAGQDVSSKVPVSKIAIFELKLGDLPAETINAYVFPLEKPDVVLGMGWLEKHNPLPDWKLRTWEFTRNGRKYQLNPTRRIPTLRVVDTDTEHLNTVEIDPSNIEISEPDPSSKSVIDAVRARITQLELRQRARSEINALEAETHQPEPSTSRAIATNATTQSPRARLRDPKHQPRPPDPFEKIDKLLEEDDREEPSLSKRGKKLEGRNKIRHFRNVVLRWLKKFGRNLARPVGIPAKLQPFTIDTGSQPPIKIPPRKYSPSDQEKIKEFIDEGLKSGVISESESPWSFPIVIAEKHDGSPRICIDYRALNAVTVKDAHPIPQIDESFLHFSGAKYFTLLDMKSGYWQIGMDLASKLKTAFSTRYGHYHWNVLPFGLTNGVAGYQRRVNFVLAKYLDKFVLVYLDDVLIFSETLEEHTEHVTAVLETLSEAGMILNLDKCQFFVMEVKFLGHIVSAEGIRPDPENIAKVLEWPVPRTITDVRGFNNLANHYARYIENFAGLALPLTDLQKGSPPKGAAIEWTPECQDAFEKIKTAITTSPVLIHVDMSKPFVLDPDSSQFRIGAVLQQYSEDPDGKQRLHPVAFESKKLTPTEQRYSSQERELLAAKHALNHWHHLLDGSETVIRTDHESLKVYRTKRPMTKRLARFMGEIEHYDPTIVYRPGKLQVVPDALSRMAGRCEGPPADTDRFQAMENSSESGDSSEDGDDVEPHPSRYYRRIVAWLSGNEEAEMEEAEMEEMEIFKEECEKYVLGRKKDALFNRRSRRRVIWVLEGMKRLMRIVHEDLGHYGKEATVQAVRQRFEVASDLWEEGKKVLDGCIPCQLFMTVPNYEPTAAIHPYESKDPFQYWQIDFVGPLEETPLGNQYLITAIDYCTGKAIAYPLPRRSAEAAMDVIEEIVWTYGPPENITTDNGQEFESHDFNALLQRYDIERDPTSPGHPQTNGKVERLNHELVQRLSRISAEDGHRIDNWDLYLQRALFAFSVHTNSRTGMWPFKLQYGVEPRLPSAAALSKAPISTLERAVTIDERKKRVKDLSQYRSVAAEKYHEAITRLAELRDDTAFIRDPIQRGDLVMRSPINRQSKLHPKWEGPFVVLDYTDSDAYQLASANGYILKTLTNKERIRRLAREERARYADEFWAASDRLHKHDELAKQQKEINELEIRAHKATIDNLERQKRGERAPLTEFAEISRLRQELASRQPATVADSTPDSTPQPRRGLRMRLPTRKAQEAAATS